MEKGYKKKYFDVMYTSYKNRHANRDPLMLVIGKYVKKKKEILLFDEVKNIPIG